MNSKSKIIGLCSIFIVIIILLTSAFIIWDINEAKQYSSKQINVDINEITYKIDNGDIEGAKEGIRNLPRNSGTIKGSSIARYVITGSVSIVAIISAFIYIYVTILKPFDKLSGFASRVAAGDLDVPLEQERGQYFGKFTWAFDSMRKEIKKARDAEKTAIENNKTVIATLSHDIKTPISSIRTYCEALDAGLDRTPEKRSHYLNTIMEKCDEVGRLTDDLFVHSVSDMNQLSVTPVRIELGAFMKRATELLSVDGNLGYGSDIKEETFIKADPARLTQILENLVANSGKYAGTRVDIYTHTDDGKVVIEVRDYGSGIPEENLPFITQKFYRGNNIEGIQGSGLGLYICSYLADKMDAELILNNVYSDNEDSVCEGLVAKITFGTV